MQVKSISFNDTPDTAFYRGGKFVVIFNKVTSEEWMTQGRGSVNLPRRFTRPFSEVILNGYRASRFPLCVHFCGHPISTVGQIHIPPVELSEFVDTKPREKRNRDKRPNIVVLSGHKQSCGFLWPQDGRSFWNDACPLRKLSDILFSQS